MVLPRAAAMARDTDCKAGFCPPFFYGCKAVEALSGNRIMVSGNKTTVCKLYNSGIVASAQTRCA